MDSATQRDVLKLREAAWRVFVRRGGPWIHTGWHLDQVVN